jgi:hypothetical protein
MINDVLTALDGYVKQCEEDQPEVQLFLTMRLMNALCAKASVALNTIRGVHLPHGQIEAYKAAIDVYQYQSDIMANGIQKSMPKPEEVH